MNYMRPLEKKLKVRDVTRTIITCVVIYLFITMPVRQHINIKNTEKDK